MTNRHRWGHKPATLVVLLAATVQISHVQATAENAGPSNMARGAPYVMSPAPTYSHCTDPGDVTQLTDGVLTDGYFWTQRGTVGWQNVRYATITIDLGKVEPIRGVSIRTAAGTAGVLWPTAICIHVSDDGKSYRDAGDLIRLHDAGPLAPTPYSVRRLATTSLKTRGRYVRLFVIPTGPYVFADEIEVFRGDPALLDAPLPTSPAVEPESSYLRYQVEARARRRFDADISALKRVLDESAIDAAAKEALATRLDGAARRLGSPLQIESPEAFRAVLPLNEAHADLFAIQAALWKTAGRPALSAWPVGAWDPLDLFGPPSPAGLKQLEVHTLRGEHRAAAFNMANATQASMPVSIHLSGLPGGPAPRFITAHRVPWTDTADGQPVAAALVELVPEGGKWTVDLAPGLAQQVWMTFHITDLPAGRHAGEVVLNAPGVDEVRIPLELTVYAPRFPTKTTLWLGGWSYTDGTGKYAITPANHKAFVEHLRSRFVNAPWATAAVMMQCTFEGDTPRLETLRFDDWLTQWPDARAYLVFAAVGRSFAGAATGTPEFDRRVGNWISAWVRHLSGKGIAANRLGLLLVDEPRQTEDDETIIAWARAIRAAEPDVLIWEDPLYANPHDAKPEMLELCSIVCPNRPMWLEQGKPFAEFYRDQQRAGRTLQLYSCSGPVRVLDPYTYYRLQAWHCRQIGATGSFFWAFGDDGNASSWNEYALAGAGFTPLFIDDTSVTAGKHMEAIREGVEDYEYFVMLDGMVAKAASDPRKSQAVAAARDLLVNAPDDVLLPEVTRKLQWHAPKDRTRADHVRVRLLEAMATLSDESGR